ncbi:unnamed protein product [Rotaria sp. Silwood2]|nr:unnamed protein product [Rotaria sp. Silwood2]
MFDQNNEIILACVTITQKLLLHNINENIEKRDVKQKLLADLLCDRYLIDLLPLINLTYFHESLFLRGKVLVLRQQDIADEYLRQLIETPLADSIQIRCLLLLCD